jgi:hypothetical protein
MTDTPDPKRVETRADELLAEETEVGSDDPQAQAEAILADSDTRTTGRAVPDGPAIERRQSEDTVEPVD